MMEIAGAAVICLVTALLAVAVSLGAKAVWIGRLWIYALATDGQAGGCQLIDMLTKEMRVAMALSGCRDLKALDREILL